MKEFSMYFAHIIILIKYSEYFHMLNTCNETALSSVMTDECTQ